LLVSSALPQTVPLRWSGGQLLVDVSFGAAGPYRPMLLDTGAPTVISRELAEAIAVRPAGATTLRTPGAGPVSMDRVIIPELRIGPMTFREVIAAVPPRGHSALGDFIGHGLIGADLMQLAVWHIDTRAGSLTVARSLGELVHQRVTQPGYRHPAHAAMDFLPASRASPSPVLTLAVDGMQRRFLLDTGSDGGIAKLKNEDGFQATYQ
jgi:hypothetical protein